MSMKFYTMKIYFYTMKLLLLRRSLCETPKAWFQHLELFVLGDI